jgi:hypothetical protein
MSVAAFVTRFQVNHETAHIDLIARGAGPFEQLGAALSQLGIPDPEHSLSAANPNGAAARHIRRAGRANASEALHSVATEHAYEYGGRRRRTQNSLPVTIHALIVS